MCGIKGLYRLAKDKYRQIDRRGLQGIVRRYGAKINGSKITDSGFLLLLVVALAKNAINF